MLTVRQEVEFEKSNHALGKPVDVEKLLGLVDAVYEECRNRVEEAESNAGHWESLARERDDERKAAEEDRDRFEKRAEEAEKKLQRIRDITDL